MTPKIVKKMINYLNNYEKYNLVNLFLLYKTENFVDYLIKLKKIQKYYYAHTYVNEVLFRYPYKYKHIIDCCIDVI